MNSLHVFLGSREAFSSFIDCWERGELARSEWNHAAHIAIATHYIVGDASTALQRMKKGILHYNQVNGIANTRTSGYHETLTRFWIGIVAGLVQGYADSWEAAQYAVATLRAQRNLPRCYYSFDVVQDASSRLTWIPPDLEGPYPILFKLTVTDY